MYYKLPFPGWTLAKYVGYASCTPWGRSGGANHSDNMKTLALIRCCCGTRSGDENRDPLAEVEAAAMVNETGGDG